MNNKLIGIIIGVAIAAIAIFLIVGMMAPQSSTSDYKVTYDGNGGTVNGDKQYAYNESTFVDSVTATWPGHDFNGWYKDKACTEKMVGGTKLTSDITVYAGWSTNCILTKTGLTIIGQSGLFSVVSKTGNIPINSTMMFCYLPDSGTTRIIATGGTDFEIIKDTSNKDYLKFTHNSKTYFVDVSLTGITGNVTVGIDKGFGYFEFSYNSNVNMEFRQLPYGITYDANEGSYSGSTKDSKIVYDLTCKSNVDLQLVPPDTKTFEGWYTEETGGTKVNVGSTVTFDGESIILYAQYV